MPRTYLMSWEGEPHFRWVKMYKGVRHRVTCKELKAPVWTKEATAAAANKWWERKKAEIDGPSPTAQVIDAVQAMPLAELRELADRGDALRRILEQLPFVRDQLAREDVERVVGAPVASEADALDKLQQTVARATGAPQAPTDRTWAANCARYLAVHRGKPATHLNTVSTLAYLGKAPGISPGLDVARIGPEVVEAVYIYIRDSDATAGLKKNRWGTFKALLRYFWEAGLMELPRNLDSPRFRFRAPARAVPTWPVADVRACLAGCTDRQRLWALLGLNCGMTNVDIGTLRKDQIDLTAGRLVRKRVKTEDHDRVPTVDYQLWPETLALLRAQWSSHDTLALTSARGTALLDRRWEGDKARSKDLMRDSWCNGRDKPPIPLKAFRSISATLLEGHPTYGRYKGHFLGHSPRTIADKHYAAPSADLFDQALAWLHGQIFGPA